MTDPHPDPARVRELVVHLLRATVAVQGRRPDLTSVEILTALVEVADGVLADMGRGPKAKGRTIFCHGAAPAAPEDVTW